MVAEVDLVDRCSAVSQFSGVKLWHQDKIAHWNGAAPSAVAALPLLALLASGAPG